MRALLIAEKPSLMKEVQAVYNKIGHKDQITFKTFAGHTMTLQEPHDYKPEWEKWDLSLLPMVPERFKYKPSKDKVAMYKDIKEEVLSGKYDYIINCCDPGREGQHIFFSFYDATGAKLPVKRMWHSDLTEGELKRALENMRDETETELVNMTIASKYRAYFDWLIGLNGTRAVSLSSTANKKINVGRVMTPVLKLLVDRELEIRNFVSKPFWEIEGDFSKYKGIYFDDKAEQEEAENGDSTAGSRFFDKASAEALIAKLGDKGKIISVKKKVETKYAPPLHSLDLLGQEANRLFGYTIAEALEIAQMLYEKKLLSYPRTNSPFITTAIAKTFPKYLKPLLSIPELKDKASQVMSDASVLASIAKDKKYVNDAKVTDHYAIIPTDKSADLSTLSQKEQNIYKMVCRRFLAIFLPPMKTNKTNIVTENNGHKFKTTGSVLVSLGFMELYDRKGSDNVLPDVKEGEIVDLKSTRLIEKKTTPPQRYNDESLAKAMANPGKFIEDEELSSVFTDEKGLGTPATRGATVEKLVKLLMIERKGSGKVKAFHASDFGIEIIEGLKGKDITLPELTATWEHKLTEIEKGTYKPSDFYNEMIKYATDMVEDFKRTRVSVTNNSDKEVLGKCPKCQSPVYEGKSYYLCKEYKNTCDFVLGKEIGGAKISKTEVKKLLSGKETKELELTFRSGAVRKTKLKLNEEGRAVPIDRVSSGTSSSGGSSGERKSLGKCPKCSKNVIEGKDYYLCEDYRNPCDFLLKKVFSGANLAAKDVEDLLAGKETREMEFTWSSGSKGKAKLKWGNNKLDFIFANRK